LVRYLGVVGLLAALTACGGEAPDPTPGPPEEPNTTRPEGAWTSVRWLSRRSDTTVGLGQATERRYLIEPTCDSGPCDLVVSPNGAEGSYLPDGYPQPDPTPAPAEGFTLAWQPATSTYEYAQPPQRRSCTTVDSRVVPDAYEVATKFTLTFTPAAGGTPAALRGTYTESAKGVGAGIAAKCTDYEAEWTFASAPTRDAPDDQADLSGTYVVTEVVAQVEPPGRRAPGFAGILLPASTVAKVETGFTITGTAAAPATLTLGPTGWSGEVTGAASCGSGAGAVAGGFTQVERWTDLQPVATTAAGDPVLTGQWEGTWTPTAGNEARCTAERNQGYVLLIPKSALTPA
jgi:hypothetical protein